MMNGKKNQVETTQIENTVGDHKQAAVDFLDLVAKGRIEEAPHRTAGTTTRIFGQDSQRCKKGCRRTVTSSRRCG